MSLRNLRAMVAGACILGIAATTAVGPHVPAARAAGWPASTFHNTAAGYSIQYPSKWQRSSVTGLDLFTSSPDSLAFISANATKSTMTRTQIHLAQEKAFLHFGKLQGKAKYVIAKLGGVDFLVGEVVVQTSDKSYADVIVADAKRGNYVYDFNGGVKLKHSASDADGTIITDSLRTFTLK
jgi:hypothetical protein